MKQKKIRNFKAGLQKLRYILMVSLNAFFFCTENEMQ